MKTDLKLKTDRERLLDLTVAVSLHVHEINEHLDEIDALLAWYEAPKKARKR